MNAKRVQRNLDDVRALMRTERRNHIPRGGWTKPSRTSSIYQILTDLPAVVFADGADGRRR
jgi:hypothetical protein